MISIPPLLYVGDLWQISIFVKVGFGQKCRKSRFLVKNVVKCRRNRFLVKNVVKNDFWSKCRSLVNYVVMSQKSIFSQNVEKSIFGQTCLKSPFSVNDEKWQKVYIGWTYRKPWFLVKNVEKIYLQSKIS